MPALIFDLIESFETTCGLLEKKTAAGHLCGRLLQCDVRWIRRFKSALGLGRIGEFGQSGDFAGGGAPMQDPFFGSLVNGGLGNNQGLIDTLIGFFGFGRSDFLDNVFHPGFHGTVALPAHFILSCAF
jgi:hypothetical protein